MKQISNNIKLDYKDVLIEPAPSLVTLTRKMIDINVDYGYFKGVPIVIANMLSTGTYKIANIMAEHNILTFIHKEYSVKEHLEYFPTLKRPELCAITSGVQPRDKERTIEICNSITPGFINVDIANPYANVQGMIDTIKLYKEKFPHIKIVAGNVCNTIIVKDLVDAGADIIKIGVGPGAACKTRTEVGTGIPQFSAVLEVADYAKQLGVRTIADGGCVTSGDVCKALAAGADFVMIAGMVSKSLECDNVVEIDGTHYVNFFGLGSNTMYNLTSPSEQEYRPNEGRDLLIPVTGSIVDVIKQIKGALRSVCTYVGVDSVSKLYDAAKFVRVNSIVNRSLEKYEK
jgi:GMP reductase